MMRSNGNERDGKKRPRENHGVWIDWWLAPRILVHVEQPAHSGAHHVGGDLYIRIERVILHIATSEIGMQIFSTDE
jgi:hypothetical protein